MHNCWETIVGAIPCGRPLDTHVPTRNTVIRYGDACPCVYTDGLTQSTPLGVLKLVANIKMDPLFTSLEVVLMYFSFLI